MASELGIDRLPRFVERMTRCRRSSAYNFTHVKLSELAARLDCRLEGDGDIEILRVAAIEEAGPGDVTFFANPNTRWRAARAPRRHPSRGRAAAPCAMLRAHDPYLAFARAVGVFAADDRPPPACTRWRHRRRTLRLGERRLDRAVRRDRRRRVDRRPHLVSPPRHDRAAHAIGDDCVIHSHVSIRERVTIGNRVVLQDGAVIGSDGFGFAARPTARTRRSRRSAAVVIEDDVEIGANTTIDRPAVGETRIGAGTKIDNLVQIAHGVTRRAQRAAGGAGRHRGQHRRSKTRWCWRGRSASRGHLTIGEGAVADRADRRSPIRSTPGAHVSGYPAIDNRDWLKSSAVFASCPS